MPRTAKSKINADILVWARESAGLKLSAAARKAQVKPEQLEAWEAGGESSPTIAQLRKLGRVYKRPIAIFYLSERPIDFQPMRDFRRFPGRVAGIESPALRYEMRRARDRRDVALELYEDIAGPIPDFAVSGTLTTSPDQLGNSLRDALGVTLDDQIRWRPGRDTFRSWRRACEEAGVLVLQMTDVDPDEANGFSIAEHPLPVIAINRKILSFGRKVFTLAHELAHIALRSGGLCDLTERGRRPPEELRTEVFCNQVAAAMLVPRTEFLAEQVVSESRSKTGWSDSDIENLSRRYGVSREVVVRRLLTLGKTTKGFYETKKRQYDEEAAEYDAATRRRWRESEGGPHPATLAVGSAGELFTRLVLGSYHQERISAATVSDFLEVRLKHLPRIESQVFRGSETA